MNLEQLRARQCQLLRERIAAIGRIRHGLHYTLGHLPSPVPPTDQLDDARPVALAAFNERFCPRFRDRRPAHEIVQGTMVRGPDSVPRMSTSAGRWPKMPTVTTPAIWLISVSSFTGSAISRL